MTDVHFALQNKHLCPHVYYLETRQGYQEIFFFILKILHDSTPDSKVWSQSWLTFFFLSSMTENPPVCI